MKKARKSQNTHNQNNNTQVNSTGVNRRMALAALGTTGLAFITGSSHAEINSADEYIDGAKIYINVSAMKSDKHLRIGDIVVTLGYYNAGDQGGNTYRIIAAGKESQLDGGSLIGLNGDVSAELIGVRSVNYRMFGAVGDSYQDDGVYIKAAHEYANKHQIPLINHSGEYWIKQTRGIEILTNVEWGHSIFHIDEKYNSKEAFRFMVKSSEPHVDINLDARAKEQLLKQIKPGVKVIPELAAYKNALVFIVDRGDRIGYRYGASYQGQHHFREEFFYVEEGGRIIGDVAWEFRDYTSLRAYPCDSNYLIIDGGTFYLSGDNPKARKSYLKNGFGIYRSRTIIRNQWVGLEPGRTDISLNTRSGFYNFSRTYDVALENVRLIPWLQDRKGQAHDVPGGTYGLGCGRTLRSRFFNVTAEGSKGYWGVFGTNLNKDFIIDQCTLNRVDVHFHCWNLHIKNSNIGYRGITVTGGGNLIVENTTVWSRHYFLSFRRDFGSRWDGDIYISNCRYIPALEERNVILNFIPADFDYHYPIIFGRTIRVTNLIIDYRNSPESAATCWLMWVPSFSKMKNGDRLFFPKQVSFKNVTVEGRKKGVRLMSIYSPQGYKQYIAGGTDAEQLLQTNSSLSFENIQLEKIEDASSKTEAHLFLNKDEKIRYMDSFSLYPNISVKECNHFSAVIAGSANVRLDHCNINHLVAGQAKPLDGGIELNSCVLQPIVQEDRPPYFILSMKSGVSFINCLFLSPIIKGEIRPELIDNTGVIAINKSVRYNHLNTRLGGAILAYCKRKSIRLNRKFINMIKVHSELEPNEV